MLFKFKNANSNSDEHHSWFNTDQIISVTDEIKKNDNGWPLLISLAQAPHEKVNWRNLMFYFNTKEDRDKAFLALSLLMNDNKKAFLL